MKSIYAVPADDRYMESCPNCDGKLMQFSGTMAICGRCAASELYELNTRAADLLEENRELSESITTLRAEVAQLMQERDRRNSRAASSAQNGENEMTAEDILSDVQLIDLTHRDAQFVRAELIDKINCAIAAAVRAERERGDALISELYDAWKDAPLQIAQRPDRAEAMTKAAAIRARGQTP